MSAIALVVAVAENGVIGEAGAIPWHISDDMRHFKAVTLGKPCLMGRKTWDSLPKKPLPGRANIVITRDRGLAAEGAIVAHSVDDAVAQAAKSGGAEICVIGGADIYRATLALARRIYLTEVHRAFAGDARFTFDRRSWREVQRDDRTDQSGLRYSFVTLERASPS